MAAEPILSLPAQGGDQNSVPCPSEPSRGRARLGLAGAASGAARLDAPDGAGARPSATAATTPSANSILSGAAAMISAARRSGRFDVVAHQREPAREHPMVADRVEHLRRRGEPHPPVLLALAECARHAGREPRQRLRPLAASPGERRRLARERPTGGVRRPARPFDERRPEPGQTADEPPDALALASEQRARRMTGETPRQPRRPQRPLIDA